MSAIRASRLETYVEVVRAVVPTVITYIVVVVVVNVSVVLDLD